MPRDILAGTDVNWIDVGEGPATLLLHCALGHAGAWLPLMGDLRGRRLIAFDMPGHGQSGPWDPERDDHTHTLEIAKALIDRVGSVADIIGHSYGATVALRLAMDAPEMVRSLVLIEPVLFAAANLANPQALASYESACAAQTEAFARGDLESAAQLFCDMWGDAPWDALGTAHKRYCVERVPMIPRSIDTVAGDQFGMVPRLPEVSAPTLLMAGTETPSIIATVQEALAMTLPRAERVVIGGGGHMVPMSHPKAVAAAIQHFYDPGTSRLAL